MKNFFLTGNLLSNFLKMFSNFIDNIVEFDATDNEERHWLEMKITTNRKVNVFVQYCLIINVFDL